VSRGQIGSGEFSRTSSRISDAAAGDGRPMNRIARPSGLAGGQAPRRRPGESTDTWWGRIQDRASRARPGRSRAEYGNGARQPGGGAAGRGTAWDEPGVVPPPERDRPRGLSGSGANGRVAELPRRSAPYGTSSSRGRGGGGGGKDGRRPRRKGDWWRHWTLKKALGLVAAMIGGFVILCAAGIAYAYSKTPIPTNIQDAALNAASTVYFSDGKTVVGKFGSTDRQPLTYSQIPALVRNAVIAAEDKNFWHEGGISPSGILRAAYYDLTSSSGSLQGGSTITQQLVRNYYTGIGTQQTLSRKIKEIFVAVKLAKAEPKTWILDKYLNTVYFGKGAYGIGAAAETYFGVSPSHLSRLTAGQAAMLASMIQSPSYYDPDPNGGAAHQALVARWRDYVLPTMVTMGAISQQTAAQAEQKFPTVVHQANLTWNGYRGYIMNRVRYELETSYGYSWAQIENDGLHITTTVSQRLMDSLRATVRQNETLMRHNTPPHPPAAVGGVTPDGLPKYVNVGALLEDPHTGAILAMYSGPNYAHHQYDNALQSRNQVGSSFKPYVLATAVKQGMNVQTSKLNGWSPLWIPPDSDPMTYARPHLPAGGDSASWYQVSNDEVSNPNRPVSVVEATALSLNTSYTDLWHRVAYSNGQHNVVNMAKAFGVDTQLSGLWRMRDESGTALGQASLTVAEQASMIATLADNGVYHSQHMIQKILTNTGQNIPIKVQSHEVLTPAQTADVDYAMSFDTSPMGTAAGMGLTNGQTIIAKTGTTNLAQSAFFLGATPRDAMAVGMFVNKPKCPARLQQFCQSQQSLAYKPPPGVQTLFGVGGFAGYGGEWPTVIWHDFFMKNFNRFPPIPWMQPNNDGTTWNLVGPFLRTKPKSKHTHTHGPGCHGHGNGNGNGQCQGTPTPTPTATGPTPTPTPSTPTPTPTSTCPPPPTPCHSHSPKPSHGPSAAAFAPAAAAAAGAPLAMLLIVVLGPALPLAARLRPRRRPRASGR
jgi:membrane peptidoglycan carboxypeptidase